MLNKLQLSLNRMRDQTDSTNLLNTSNHLYADEQKEKVLNWTVCINPFLLFLLGQQQFFVFAVKIGYNDLG